MEKKWGETAVPWNAVKPKSKKKKKKVVKGRESYEAMVKRLEQVVPDDELRDIGRNFGTKRKNVDYDNICRVVPGDWIKYPNLLEMNKENYIYPELAVKEMYQQLLLKIGRK